MSDTPTDAKLDAKAGPLTDLAALIAQRCPGVVLATALVGGELTLHVQRTELPGLVSFLRNDPACAFTTLVDICGVDYPERERRFDVVYHFLSMRRNHRIRLKVEARADEIVPSILAVHPSANWYEREVFDMYGVLFSGHPDLRRILTDYGFRGHPLRKDFPTTGFVEVRYDETVKRVVYEPVKLTQEYRQFDFLSPWEGEGFVLPGDEKRDKV